MKAESDHGGSRHLAFFGTTTQRHCAIMVQRSIFIVYILTVYRVEFVNSLT